MTGGTLPVGACDMYAAEVPLRPSEKFTEMYGIVEIFPVGRRTDAAEHGQPAKEIIEGFRVVHI